MAYKNFTGTLRDANNNPIPLAAIKFTATATSDEVLQSVTATVKTDINGHYDLNLNHGRYEISIKTANSPSFYVLVKDIVINADTIETDLNSLISIFNQTDLFTPALLAEMRNIDAATQQTVIDTAASAAAAATSANAAATSETNADQSAQAALVSQQAAQTSETNAATSETNAAESATAAATSETNADQSAQAAETSETNAATSESNSAQSATNASNSATAAATSETNAANSAAAALASQQAAATSEGNADQSAQAALTSEGNAATSETNAAQSATNASNSASESAASAQSASDSLSGATSAQIAAGNYASAAATSATNASNSANSAATSETNAAQSAAEAAQSAQQAQTAASSAVQYLGGWDASSGTLPPTTGVTDGDQYRVTVAGTVNSVDYNVGDFIFFDSGAWQLVDNTDSVTSVAGKTGAITLTKSDVGLSNVRNVSSYSQTETDGLLNTKLGSTESAVSADKLTTARTITLSGDLSGSVGFDGSQNVTITTTVNNSDKLDGVQASQFVRNDTTNTISGIQKFTGHVRWQVSDSDVAFQNADARDEGTRSRLHWYGGSAGSSLNAAHAYYDGTNYHNLDVLQGEFRFDAGVYASGGFRGDGSQIVNVDAQTLDGINSTQFLRADVNDTKTGYLWLQNELFVGGSATNAARLRVVADLSRVYIQSYDKDDTNIAKEFVFSGYGGKDIGDFRVKANGDYQDIWHSGNDGTGSGLDADLLDGLQSTDFARLDTTVTIKSGASYRSVGVARDDQAVSGVENKVALDVETNTGHGRVITLEGGSVTNTLELRRDGSIFGGPSGSSPILDTSGNINADTVDGLHGYQLVRSDTADTVSGRLTLTNSGGTETHYGIHGGYNDSNGNGTGWGAPIWSMGDGFMGTGTGANFTAPGGYQLAWQRVGNANSRSEIGEGVYIYSANLFAGGIGRDGAHLARGLTVTGNASVSGDITSNGHRVYHGGNIHFSTSDPTSSDGQDGDIWFVYED